MSIIRITRRPRQESHKFKTSLHNIVRPCFKKEKEKEENEEEGDAEQVRRKTTFLNVGNFQLKVDLMVFCTALGFKL